jgi:hypothetical protein
MARKVCPDYRRGEERDVHKPRSESVSQTAARGDRRAKTPGDRMGRSRRVLAPDRGTWAPPYDGTFMGGAKRAGPEFGGASSDERSQRAGSSPTSSIGIRSSGRQVVRPSLRLSNVCSVVTISGPYALNRVRPTRGGLPSGWRNPPDSMGTPAGSALEITREHECAVTVARPFGPPRRTAGRPAQACRQGRGTR